MRTREPSPQVSPTTFGDGPSKDVRLIIYIYIPVDHISNYGVNVLNSNNWPPKYHKLLLDPGTPFWARRLLVEIANKDPVDVVNALEVILGVAKERMETVFAANTQN